MKKILIANRGEIALRVIRAAREMGIRTVAVASEADLNSLHAKAADEVVLIGAGEPSQSYLVADRIIAAARETGAEAIHPGYGFLSERAEFAEACQAAGLIFIGPSPKAMRALGGKIEAKALAVSQGVSVTPGFFEPDASDDQLYEAAERIGYPVMLKASAGGGGRGMRIVFEPDDLRAQLRLARDEALKGFGDDAMMVEKLVLKPRHIEVQVLADHHGRVAALYERECSLQRRHQKLIEEAPSPIMTEALWQTLREASLKLVMASGYTNAGTVEFMVDEETGLPYFLEVNARLQVEHPVTEAITGIDLVQWQIRIARGEKLDLPTEIMVGDRSGIRGHSLELRIVAEDPAKNFLPSIGPIFGWAPPSGPGIRFDSGYGEGSEVSRFYDSLLAKLIVQGENREAAVERLRLAALDTHILGVKTNIPFALAILDHPEFRLGAFDTGWLKRHFEGWSGSDDLPEELGSLMRHCQTMSASGGGVGLADGARGMQSTAWSRRDGWRVV
ncbi:MAG: ATP-grasp domain-containing protein [Fimbriimonadaceae bacterium]|jgi:acetyl/propionyl-CoA carboxylase alpha subunit|nr:ATP-grasp domain-containing protein [Fimbriimonadaceae bacterium]